MAELGPSNNFTAEVEDVCGGFPGPSLHAICLSISFPSLVSVTISGFLFTRWFYLLLSSCRFFSSSHNTIFTKESTAIFLLPT